MDNYTHRYKDDDSIDNVGLPLLARIVQWSFERELRFDPDLFFLTSCSRSWLLPGGYTSRQEEKVWRERKTEKGRKDPWHREQVAREVNDWRDDGGGCWSRDGEGERRFTVSEVCNSSERITRVWWMRRMKWNAPSRRRVQRVGDTLSNYRD